MANEQRKRKLDLKLLRLRIVFKELVVSPHLLLSSEWVDHQWIVEKTMLLFKLFIYWTIVGLTAEILFLAGFLIWKVFKSCMKIAESTFMGWNSGGREDNPFFFFFLNSVGATGEILYTYLHIQIDISM